MDKTEGIPLWEFIKPKAQNKVYEVAGLLLFYAEYQEQIDRNQDNLDLFLTELLYAGFDCLVSEKLLTGETIANEFNIPSNSPLFQFTQLLEKFNSEPKTETMKEILKTFPIVQYTRIGRDLLIDRNWIVKRETELKKDPETFASVPLSRKDLDFKGRDSDLPDIIKKGNKRFEEQFSKEYPHLSSNKIISDLVQEAIKESKNFAKQVNNLPKISQLAEDLTGLTRIKPALKRKPGQERGAIREGSNYDYKRGRKEYDDLLQIVKEVKKKVNEMEAKKDEAVSIGELFPFFGGSLSEEELTLIDLDEPPAKSAFAIWQLRNPHVADSLRTFRRRFPKKE